MRGGEERRRGARRGERRRATLRAGAACMISIYGVDEDEEEGGGCVGAGACVRSRMEGTEAGVGEGREGTAQTVGLPFACGVERVRVECESEQENSSAEEVLSGVDRREAVSSGEDRRAWVCLSSGFTETVRVLASLCNNKVVQAHPHRFSDFTP